MNKKVCGKLTFSSTSETARLWRAESLSETKARRRSALFCFLTQRTEGDMDSLTVVFAQIEKRGDEGDVKD